MDKRGEYQGFTWKIFCLTMPKFSVGRSLYCFINVGYRKSLDKRGGGVSRFSVENFLPRSAENLRSGVPFRVSIISGIEKVWFG